MTRTRALSLYVLVAFGWAWLLWVPYAAMQQGVVLPPALARFFGTANSFGAWGPLVAALLVTYLDQGRAGVVDLARRGVRWRFGLAWWLVALLMYPALIATSLILGVRLGDAMPELPMLAQPLTVPIAFIVVLLNYGPLQEEFGWRGFVQDRLQTGWSALAASVAVGLMWGVWHLPLFYMNRTDPYYQEPFWGLLLSTVLASILFAWVYNNTGRSILAAMVIHASFNWAHVSIPTLGLDWAPQILLVLQVIVIAVVVAVWRPRSLTRSGGDEGATV